jgi:hypothetical protein
MPCLGHGDGTDYQAWEDATLRRSRIVDEHLQAFDASVRAYTLAASFLASDTPRSLRASVARHEAHRTFPLFVLHRFRSSCGYAAPVARWTRRGRGDS